ncbi:DUF5343 domain-containing protein [Aquirhabdus sp.]|uniref:DUF5343 domain-containing protein n=1 Tax=Aquirhabdus sp. TaxID=2824160 RepID=UPI00396CF4F9
MVVKKNITTDMPNAEGVEPADKKSKSTIKYPPYVNAYGAIPKLFLEISKASVPPKFTQDFMDTVLELRSSSHRALIPLLKKLNFIDAANTPTEAYRNYRDETQRESVMAAQIRFAYSDLYKANEYAHNLKKEELQSKLRALLGAAEDDPIIPAVIGTYLELAKLADFKQSSSAPKIASPSNVSEKNADEGVGYPRHLGSGSLGLSYTINLNLPATTEIEVFNAIFKSLKEHLLDN